MSEILKHELMLVPIAIAETNGSLRSGNKSLLLDILNINGVIVEMPVKNQLQGMLAVLKH